jgi:predicted kinase
VAVLFLLVGLPAAGKTTMATRLAGEHRALRLTPDEWMLPLFGESEAGGKRDVLEGRLISVALQVLRLGGNVVLDFGCWAKDERSALRWLTEREGASFRLVYVSVDRATQLERIEQRWRQVPHETFPISVSDIDRWRDQFEVPDAGELGMGSSDAPPAREEDWLSWAQDRWPSLSTG